MSIIVQQDATIFRYSGR